MWTKYSLSTNRSMSNIVLCTNKSYETSTLQYGFRTRLFTHFRQKQVSVECYPNSERTQNMLGSSSIQSHKSIMTYKNLTCHWRGKRNPMFLPHLSSKKYNAFSFFLLLTIFTIILDFPWANLSWNIYVINLDCLKYVFLSSTFWPPQ